MPQQIASNSEPSLLSALTIQLLEWIAARPRTYDETMAAWRTSCARMPVWEDAIDGGLIAVSYSDGVGMNGATVRLTDLGASVLAGGNLRPKSR